MVLAKKGRTGLEGRRIIWKLNGPLTAWFYNKPPASAGAPPAGTPTVAVSHAIVETRQLYPRCRRAYPPHPVHPEPADAPPEQQLACTLLDRSGRQVVTTAQGGDPVGLRRRIPGLLARAGSG